MTEFTAERLLERAAQIDKEVATWKSNDAYAQTLRMDAWALRTAAKVNSPETNDWMAGVPLEAAHQVERWGALQDAGKSPLDWYWLLGYLAQKAAAAAMAGDLEKAKHHTVSSAAVMLNWHRHLSGESVAMRPGIDPVARGVEAART